MDPIALLSLVVAAVALGASIIANQRSLAAAKASSDLALVSNMFNRRREAKFFEALAEIRRADFPQSHDTTKGFDGLPDETRANAFLVSGFFDDLGKLVAHRVVGEEI